MSSLLSDADIAYQRETLRELTDIGMDLAQTLRREVVEAPEGARPMVSGDVALSYSRIARAVRLTLALQTRVLTGEPARGHAPREEEPAHDPTFGVTRENHPYILLGAYKKVVKRVIGDAIAAESDGEAAERLTLDLYERLYERGDDDDLMGLPIGELINRIRVDLGMPALAEPWTEEERSKFRPQIMANKAAREAREREASLAHPSAGAPWRAPRPAPA